MQNFIPVTIKKVTNYGIQFHQNHYGLYVQLKNDSQKLLLKADQLIWVNIWVKQKNLTLNQRLTNASQHNFINVDANIKIKARNQFYNCQKIEFTDK